MIWRLGRGVCWPCTAIKLVGTCDKPKNDTFTFCKAFDRKLTINIKRGRIKETGKGGYLISNNNVDTNYRYVMIGTCTNL